MHEKEAEKNRVGLEKILKSRDGPFETSETKKCSEKVSRREVEKPGCRPSEMAKYVFC